MKSNPLVTIIVPAYNTEKYIRVALVSILNQTYPDIEVIVVDDGSTDRTLSICEEFQRRDSRVICYSQKNKGQAVARNFALDKAQGEYIAFVDSDDYISNDLIEKQVALAEKYKVDVVCFKMIKTNGEDFFGSVNNANEGIVIDGFFEEFIKTKGWQYHTVPCKLYKASVLQNIRFPEYRAIEDEFFLTHVFEKSKCVFVSDIVGYYYRQTENSTMRGGFNIQRMLIVKALEERAQLCLKHNNKLYIIVSGQCVLECIDWWNRIKPLRNYKTKQKEIRSTFLKHFFYGLKSPYLSIKDKIRVIVFLLMPDLYYLTVFKGRKNDT